MQCYSWCFDLTVFPASSRLQHLGWYDLCWPLSQQSSHGVLLSATGLQHTGETNCVFIHHIQKPTIRSVEYSSCFVLTYFINYPFSYFVHVCFISSWLTLIDFFTDTPANNLARRRWMLFYTLLRNPHLILLRKRHLSLSVSQEISPFKDSNTVLQAWVMASQVQNCQVNSQSPLEIEAIPAEDC